MGHFYMFSLVVFLTLLSSSAKTALPIISFDEGYNHLFGDDNLMILKDGKAVHLTLDHRTGSWSGFVSQELYIHGLFSASIKLPTDYTAGVVVAFYMSNAGVFPKNHDEIDFEFLGNVRGKEWRVQTNVYGNGSTETGREEGYNLWFDPTEDYHQYSILWTDSQIIFSIDNIPIRVVKRTESMGGDYPSKPMSLYATIWDASAWATDGGKYRVNYKYAPFRAEFSDLVLHGCAVNPIEPASKKCDKTKGSDYIPTGITRLQRTRMSSFRKRHMTYSYCYDRIRYKIAPPECVISPQEAESLRVFDPVTFGNGHRHQRNKHRHRSSNRASLADISSV